MSGRRGQEGSEAFPPPMDDEGIHETVGAYLLGLLEPEEATKFEEHLAGCERCGQQLDELAGMGPVLAALAEAHEITVDAPAGGDAEGAEVSPRIARAWELTGEERSAHAQGGATGAPQQGGTPGRQGDWPGGPREWESGPEPAPGSVRQRGRPGSAAAGARATALPKAGTQPGFRARPRIVVDAELGHATGPSPRLADRLIADVAAHRARRRRRSRMRTAGAAALIVAGPVATLGVTSTTGNTAAQQPAPSSVVLRQMPTHLHATDPSTKVHALMGLETRPWGTTTVLKLTNVGGPLKCSLVAVGANGERQTMTSWSVPSGGYGIADSKYPAAREPLYVHGSAAFKMNDIDHFEVRTLDGKSLVTVLTQPQATA